MVNIFIDIGGGMVARQKDKKKMCKGCGTEIKSPDDITTKTGELFFRVAYCVYCYEPISVKYYKHGEYVEV